LSDVKLATCALALFNGELIVFIGTLELMTTRAFALFSGKFIIAIRTNEVRDQRLELLVIKTFTQFNPFDFALDDSYLHKF